MIETDPDMTEMMKLAKKIKIYYKYYKYDQRFKGKYAHKKREIKDMKKNQMQLLERKKSNLKGINGMLRNILSEAQRETY